MLFREQHIYNCSGRTKFIDFISGIAPLSERQRGGKTSGGAEYDKCQKEQSQYAV